MADQSSLLGSITDPSQLQGLLGMLGPSQADQQMANKLAMQMFFAGLMGARKGYEGTTAAESLQGALGARQQALMNAPKLRAENMQTLMPFMQLAMNQQFAKQMQDALNNPGSTNVPTQPGPSAPFQQPGGAAALMSGATGTAPPAAPTQLPTQVPVPGAKSPAQQQFDNLTKINLQRMAMGYPDMSAAINARFPAPTALRPNAAAIDRFGNVITPPMPVPPEGSRYNPATGAFEQVPNAEQAIALPKVTTDIVSRATTPQTGVLPGGGEGITGTQLGALGGANRNGPYAFLNNLFGAPAPAVQRGPVQTKLSPEQAENSKALGEQAASYRAAMDQSSKAIAQLDQISDTLKYFTPGPTLPIRAKIAGYAQEVPGVGRSVANALVPNSATALPAIAAMEKFGVGLTAEQSKVFGSREGQQVIGMIKSAMPNAEQVPGAPETIIEAQKGVHQWIVDKALAAQQWARDPAHNGSLDGFSEAWDASHPVSSYVGNLPALANIAKGLPPGAPREAVGQQPQQAPKTVIRTGTYNGRKVVQYSDGTTAFTQ